MPLVSIIVPTCDRPDLLPRAVASVLAGVERDIELVIADHNRQTPPVEIHPCAIGWRADGRVRIHRVAAGSPRNPAAARNAGLAAATGDWIAFLDDDDSYRPEKISAQLALARSHHAPLALCGACFHLKRRRRIRGTHAALIEGDALLNAAEFGSPFLFHRRRDDIRFAEDLFAGEDLHYGQALLAAFSLRAVPVVQAPLVDVYQDRLDRTRTNLTAEAGWLAARRTCREFGRRYSGQARHLFLARARVTRAKLGGQTRRMLPLTWSLLRVGGAREIRFAANAVLVSAGWRGGVT